MTDAQPVRLDLVFAYWCPHCYPLSTERAPRLAEKIGVPLRMLDIDVRAQEDVADLLVREHGDWTEDYLIPQFFLEWSDGRVEHLLTGIPGPVAGTGRAWDALFSRFEAGPG
jgi:hypothetical protein